MNEWWNNLALREKQMVSLGALAIVVFLIYFLIWSPLDDKITSLRKQIRQNQELLAWMKEADKKINTLEKTSTHKSTTPTGSLLSTIQKEVNQSGFKNDVNQLHQSENDSVQLTFYKVDFDKLIAWLIHLSQQNIIIKQMTVTPSNTPGIVAADVVLKE